jgi:hypothetical protein
MTQDPWPYPTTSVDREDVPGLCPECGGRPLQRYPVLANGGWFLVVKCQACLHSLSREPWKRLGFVHLPEEGIL